jgi:hypothetical protein
MPRELSLSFLEIIAVDLLDDVRLFWSDTDIVLNHELGQPTATDQNHFVMQARYIVASVISELARSDEDSLCRLLPS